MTTNWTKNCLAQKNLESLMKDRVITASMGSSDLKKIADPRISAILKHSDQVVNRKINMMRNTNIESITTGKRKGMNEETMVFQNEIDSPEEISENSPFGVKFKTFNDQDPNHEPNSIVAFFLCPPCNGKPTAVVEEHGFSIVTSFELPRIDQKDFENPTESLTFSEHLQHLAEVAAFTKSNFEELQFMRQVLQTPFQIEEELVVAPVTIGGHNFFKVNGKRFVKKVASTEFETRYSISELAFKSGSIVPKENR